MATLAPAPVIAAAQPRASRGLWGDAFSRLLRNKPAMFGLVLVGIFVIAAVLAPVIAPFGPKQGSDEFSRVLYGAQISLYVGVISVIMGLTIGGIVGALAGGLGGKVDAILMRCTDVLLAIPGILLAIGIVAWLDRGLWQIMLAVAVANAPIFARPLRGSLLALREADYVVASRSIGATGGRLLLRHMLPNALTPLIVAATLALATAIIDVAGLGFLGLGPPDPRTAEWGTMLTDARSFLERAPWLLFFPGIAISITAIGFNMVGDGLRESLDPRL